MCRAEERGRNRLLEKNAERKRNDSYVVFTRYGKLIKWRVVEGSDHIAL